MGIANRRQRAESTLWTLSLTVSALLGLAINARFARSETDDPDASDRERGGHTFILTPLVRDPFATTYFDMRTTAGTASSQGTLFDSVGNPTGRRDYTLLTVAESFEYQLAPVKWLAARVGATGFVYSGDTALAALAVGAVLRYEIEGGATAGYDLNDRVRLGVSLDVSYGRRDSVDVLGAVRRSIQERQVDSGGLLQSDNVLLLAPGITGAFALHRALGLVVAVYYADTGLTSGTLPTGEHTLAPGASLDFDLRAITAVPIGLIAAYRWDAPLTNGQQSQAADLGVFYTGRRHFNLSLQLGWRHFPIRESFTADAGLATLAMRYYW